MDADAFRSNKVFQIPVDELMRTERCQFRQVIAKAAEDIVVRTIQAGECPVQNFQSQRMLRMLRTGWDEVERKAIVAEPLRCFLLTSPNNLSPTVMDDAVFSCILQETAGFV